MSTHVRGLGARDGKGDEDAAGLRGAVGRIVADLEHEFRQLPEAVGALLHGSHAQGTAREDSDVDVVCVTKADWYSKEIRLVDGFEVEIQKISVSQAQLEIEKINKPFTVRAFANSRIIFDLDGTLAELCRLAGEKWSDGAPPPSRVEVLLAKSFFRHHLEDLERLGRDPEKNRVAIEGVLGEAFMMAVRAHFRARNRWTDKTGSALEQIREIDPEFWSLASRYAETGDIRERISLMRTIVERALEPVGPLVVEYRTPPIPAQFFMMGGQGEPG